MTDVSSNNNERLKGARVHLLDTSFHDRRLEERMKDTEFRAAYTDASKPGYRRHPLPTWERIVWGLALLGVLVWVIWGAS